MDLFITIQFALLIILLILSALISGSEVAFFSLNNSDLNGNLLSEDKEIKRIKFLLKKPKRLLATILITNNFINIAVVLIFANLSNIFLEDYMTPLVKLIFEIGFITTIILLFGEIFPKVYANRNPIAFAKKLSRPIKVLDQYLLFFMTSPMSKMTRFLEKKLGSRNNDFSVDQLSQALELTSDNETTKEEQKILKGIVSFGNIDTKEIMCPRVDVFALSKKENLNIIIPKIIKNGFSRIPVFSEHLDKIDGILYVKDLLPHFNNFNFDWKKLLKEPIYVPENKKLDDLLNEFQQKKIHLAIVVDEYGGTSGIITLEDILEQIVGDISDEFDELSLSYSQIDLKNYVFDGKTSLKDFYKIVKTDNDHIFEENKAEAETLAGFILENTQKIPKPGKSFSFHGYKFLIESIDKKRIHRIKVTIP
ncbi:MAG: magnesium/cobalt efflux protein [Flavobacteriales bacterium]|nr:magnesium/cobalt efflux protein [Flavobacteriales bacterium]